MSLPFSVRLALKYLKPKRTFISAVNVLSVLGVLIGVAVLIIVISVMAGFDEMWKEKLLSFQPHIQITSRLPIDDELAFIDELSDVEGLSGASPFMQSLVVLQHGDYVFAPTIRGVDMEREVVLDKVKDSMVLGEFLIDDEHIVIGSELANQLGIRVGNEVLIYSPQTFASEDEIRLPEEMIVSGIFEVGMWQIDLNFLLCSMETALDICGTKNAMHGTLVLCEDADEAFLVANKIKEQAGPYRRVQTWMELNGDLFGVLQVEKNMMFFILVIISVVASFLVMSTIIMVTFQKTREIGLMKSLGFSSWRVLLIFVIYGFSQGILGNVLGIVTGLTILHFRNDILNFISDTFHRDLFPKEFYYLNEIPSLVSVHDVMTIFITVTVICMLAGFIPAWRAAFQDPVKALRYE